MKIFLLHKHLHNFPLSEDFLLTIVAFNSFRTFFFFFCRTPISYHQFFFTSFEHVLIMFSFLFHTTKSKIRIIFLKSDIITNVFARSKVTGRERETRKLNEISLRVKMSVKLMFEEKVYSLM